MSTNINSTEQIVEINAGDQITNVNVVSQSTTQVISGEQVVTIDTNAGTIPAAWGLISGTLSNQTDLQNALNAKQNNITLTTTGTSGAATLVGSTLNIPNYTDTGLTSVGLAMPTAFNVSGSPLTSNGTITVTGAGTGAQYIKGDGTLATFPTTIDQSLRLIREVYNKTGATLTKGTIVYINGGQGNLPTVTKAIATGDSTSAQTFGVVQSDITNNNNGYVVIAGGIDNLSTQSFDVGEALYLSPTTAGAWTTTKPYAPNHLVYIGTVVRSHPTQGVVEVRIANGYELDELHNVSARFPVNNDGLFYNSTSGVWENKSIESVIPTTFVPQTRLITINGNSQNLTADRTWNVGTVTSVAATGGTGISVVGSPITTSGSLQIINTAPDQVVSLTGTGTTSVTGTYPNFTINSADQFTGTVTSVAATAGTGISISGSPITSSGTLSITNTAPDQVVSLTPSGLVTVTGTYPNFTVGVSGGYDGTVKSVNAQVPTGFEVSGVPITTTGTIDIRFASGYSLPTNTKQSQWDTAYTKRLDSLTTDGNYGAATLINNVLNVPQYTLDGLNGEPAINLGTIYQYWRGDKTWQTLDTSSVPENGPVYFTEGRVRGTVLSGLNITGGSISSTDSVLNAFGKIQNQINGLIGGSIFQSTWNASTNTPTLTSSVGTKGYYYIVSVAGTTNLNGITDWQVGDWAIFDGTVWRKVDNTDAVVSVNGYTGVVNLVLDDMADVSAATPTNTQLLRYNGTSSKWENWTPTFEPALTKGNLTESTSSVLTISGGSNAVIGSGTSIEVKQSSASGSGYLSSTDWNTFNNKQATISLTTTGSSGAATFVSNTLNVPNYTLSGLGGVPSTRTLTINGTGYDLSSDRSWSVGTVTSVGALTLTTSGTDITSSVANGTTTPVITLNIPTASATNRGALSSTDWTTFNNKQNALTFGNLTESTSSVLTISGGSGAVIGSGTSIQVKQSSGTVSGFLSSTDWTTFNNKQAALTLTTTGTSGAATLVGATLNIPQYQSVLTNPVTGTGTTNYVTKWSSTSGITNSQIYDDASKVYIGSTSGSERFNITTTDGFNLGLYSSDDYNAINFYSSAGSYRGAIWLRTSTSLMEHYVATGYGQTFYAGNAVALTLNSSGTVRLNNYTTNGFVKFSSSNGTLVVDTTAYPSGSGTTNYIPKWTSSSALGNSLIYDSGTNIGIGTTSPQSNLHVTGTIKVATGNAQGILGLGEGAGTTVNVGIWRGAANAPTTDGNYLNLGGYDGIVFATGNAAIGSQTERMRITSGGNVGIGTTSPTQGKLVVLGDANSNTAFFGGNSTTGQSYGLHIAAGTNATDYALRVTNQGQTTDLLKILGTGAATFSSSVTAGSVLVDILSLGTDGTYGGTYKTLGLTGNTNGSHRIFAGTSDDLYIAAATGRGIRFWTNGSSGNVMTITSGGNVGIGTTSPTANINGSTNKILDITSSNFASLLFHGSTAQESSIAGGTNGLYIDVAGHATASNNVIVFRTGDTNSSYSVSERMRITSGGNVLIGTTTDSGNRLDIQAVGSYGRFKSTTGTNSTYLNFENTAGSFWVGRDSSTGGSFGGSAYAALLYSQGAYPMEFWTNGARAMVITSGGLVGIGTNTPQAILHTKTGGGEGLRIQGTATSAFLSYTDATDTSTAFIGHNGTFDIWNRSNTDMRIATNNSERMRITSGGNVGIGVVGFSSTNERLLTRGSDTTSSSYAFVAQDVNGTQLFQVRNDGGIYAGTIGTSTGTALILTASGFIAKSSSSIRYKKDIKPIDIGLDFILGLNPVSYNLKDGNIPQVGFIAEDFPEERLVSISMIDINDESKGYQKEGVNYAQIVAPLVKAIQEQQAQIEELKSKLK